METSNAVVARPMTMAVRTKACGKGSTYIASSAVAIMIGASPPSLYPMTVRKRKVAYSIMINPIAILSRFLLTRTP